MMKETKILYGEQAFTIQIPDSVDILENQNAAPVIKADEAILKALSNPIGSESLKNLVLKKRPKTVAITISDITRPVPNKQILPHILGTLKDCGINKSKITIIIGTGMHRKSTHEDRIKLVGNDILLNYRVVDHDPGDKSNLLVISDDPPVSINKIFADADFKIVTGFIEPHFMAGFSGGRKGICPALVDLTTIQKFHGFETLSSEKAAAGLLDGNPCHETALKVASLVDVDFLVNVTLDRDFRISAVFCGQIEEAHKKGCEFISTHSSCKIKKKYDLVVTCGGGYPMDINYYQSVKGMCMALPALSRGSKLLQVSECREGVGSDAFRNLLFLYDNDWKKFLSDIEAQKDVTMLDQWEFQMLCRVLETIGTEGLLFVSEGIPYEEQLRICCTPLKRQKPVPFFIEDYIASYKKDHPGASIAVIPSGPYTIIEQRAEE